MAPPPPAAGKRAAQDRTAPHGLGRPRLRARRCAGRRLRPRQGRRLRRRSAPWRAAPAQPRSTAPRQLPPCAWGGARWPPLPDHAGAALAAVDSALRSETARPCAAPPSRARRRRRRRRPARLPACRIPRPASAVSGRRGCCRPAAPKPRVRAAPRSRRPAPTRRPAGPLAAPPASGSPAEPVTQTPLRLPAEAAEPVAPGWRVDRARGARQLVQQPALELVDAPTQLSGTSPRSGPREQQGQCRAQRRRRCPS